MNYRQFVYIIDLLINKYSNKSNYLCPLCPFFRCNSYNETDLPICPNAVFGNCTLRAAKYNLPYHVSTPCIHNSLDFWKKIKNYILENFKIDSLYVYDDIKDSVLEIAKQYKL